MANNNGIFNAAYEGAAGGVQQGRWLDNSNAASYVEIQSQLVTFATAIDNGIIADPTLSDADFELMQSICQAVSAEKFFQGQTSTNLIALAAAVVAYWTQLKGSLLPVPPSSLNNLSNVRYVDSGAAVSGNGNIEAPYQTIQEAIDSLPTGGTIYVTAHVYTEDLTIAQPIVIQTMDGQDGLLSGTINGTVTTTAAPLTVSGIIGTGGGAWTIDGTLHCYNCDLTDVSVDCTNLDAIGSYPVNLDGGIVLSTARIVGKFGTVSVHGTATLFGCLVDTFTQDETTGQTTFQNCSIETIATNAALARYYNCSMPPTLDFTGDASDIPIILDSNSWASYKYNDTVLAHSAGNGFLRPIQGGLSTGEWSVDDYGALSLPFTIAVIPNEAALRALNTTAINAALEAAYLGINDTTHAGGGGGTVWLSPGVYYTDGTVGFQLAIDVNVGVKIAGRGPFPCMISCNSTTVPNFEISTTSGNIRSIYVEDLVIIGGNFGLNLVRCNYCRFNRIFFWGSSNFALQDNLGFNNVFSECYFTESAARGDAALFLGCGDILSNCTYGESSGGVVSEGGSLIVLGGQIVTCEYQGKNGFDYINNTIVNIAPTFGAFPAAFSCIGGNVIIADMFGQIMSRFLATNGAYDVTVSNCFCASSGAGFVGFFQLNSNLEGRLGLSIHGGCWTWNAGASGFFIDEPFATLRNASIAALLATYNGGTITKIGIQGGQNNIAMVNVLNRL